MVPLLKRTWAEIDLNNISHNFNAIRSFVNKKSNIMAIVKADAYGHGVSFAAKELDSAGADCFGVSNIEEAIQLRNIGIKKPVLILGFTPPEFAGELIRYNFSQTVYGIGYAKELSDYALKSGGKVKAHIKIDTGMGRIGFLYNEPGKNSGSIDEILEVGELAGLEPEGIFTHFSVSDEPKSSYTKRQFGLFCDIISKLENNGVYFKIKHCCNSAGLLNFPDMQLDMVRPGIILYGLTPSVGMEIPIEIKPAMTLKTVVSQVKTLDKDMPISYGMKYITRQKTVVATMPVGYADGFARSFSNNTDVLINGSRAAIIGRVCMDQCMADVSDIKSVRQGDIVTIVGRDGNGYISMDEFADKMGTINYEAVCLVGKRVPRLIFKDGENIDIINNILP